MISDEKLLSTLERIATALEKQNPTDSKNSTLHKIDNSILEASDAYTWHASTETFEPVSKVNRIPLELLQGITQMQEKLQANTIRFAKGLPANNALLWGARGMGKSSLVKAIHAEVNKQIENIDTSNHSPLKLIEIHREDITSLPECLHILRQLSSRIILFCDDLSFDADDTSYKSLKAVLEGGIEGKPENIIFYATSNRRHLIPRQMIDNERSTAINPGEAVEEKVSLSDRFGLWIGFHNCSQSDYMNIVHTYARYFKLDITNNFETQAHQWAMTRGSRSGRVAWQFIQDLAGEQGKILELNA